MLDNLPPPGTKLRTLEDMEVEAAKSVVEIEEGAIAELIDASHDTEKAVERDDDRFLIRFEGVGEKWVNRYQVEKAG